MDGLQPSEPVTRSTLRIGYFLRMYPRFSQTFIVNEIRELERQGAQVRILSIRKPTDGIFHESVCRVRARADYLPTTARGRRWPYARRQWRLLRRRPGAFAAAVRTIRSDAQGQWFDLCRAIELLDWVDKQKIDHVHVHFGTNEATIALLAHQLGGLSYSLTLHAFDIFRETVNRRLLAAKINASRFTVTVTEANRRFLLANLPDVDPQRLRVNYNGVDVTRFAPGDQPREPHTIFGLGRLKEKKGFVHLVGAVRRLRDEGIDVRCRIAGEGPDEKKLREAIDAWDLASQVELLGPVNEDDVRTWMRRSACFVLPCIQAKDGNVDALPTVLLEALACGCPAVSTDLSGIPEIIDHNVNGLLVAPGDDGDLAGAIRRILIGDELAASLSRRGRQRAEERFDIRRNVGVMHAWFQRAAAVAAVAGGEPAAASEAQERVTAVPNGEGAATVTPAVSATRTSPVSGG